MNGPALDRLLERLEGVQKSGDQYNAKCPAHDDRVASLTVGQGRKGAVVSCHAGCEARAVMEAVGLPYAAIFDDWSATSSRPKPVKDSGIPESVVARLREAKGWSRPTLEALRLRWNGERLVFPSGVGYLPGATPKMLAAKGSKRDLWPPPESTNGGPVYLLEGEPDAVSGHELGLEAVSVPGVSKWSDAWPPRFAGRRVVVVFDCDAPGRTAAARIAAALAPHAEEVRVVDLDRDRDDGWDLSDLLREAGKDEARKLLDRMAAAAPVTVSGVQDCTPVATTAPEMAQPRRPEAVDYALTDLGNAELFAALYADQFRYVRDRRLWIACVGGRWEPDVTGAAERAAKDVARERLRLAAELDGDAQKAAVRWAQHSQSEPRLRALLQVASTEPNIVVRAESLDSDPFLLACANGTIDLRTGQLRAHKAADLMTVGTSVAFDANARCPRWLRFLDEVFAADAELVAFVQRWVGYCLTGDTREQVLAVLYGSGDNGKTVFAEAVKTLAGGHAATAAFDTFIRARGDRGPRNDLARLHRARLVSASESTEGRRLDEATVKAVTGGDTIAARFLYSESFEFRPMFKLWLITNHRPRVDGDDDAIWRRLRLIPFEQSFLGREDRTLASTLEAELPGILNWAVEGCRAWQREGLGEAAAVTRATGDYRAEEDVLGSFLEERCELVGEVAVSDLGVAYNAYCEAAGERPLSKSSLGKRLVKRGIVADKAGGTRIYSGLRLKP